MNKESKFILLNYKLVLVDISDILFLFILFFLLTYIFLFLIQKKWFLMQDGSFIFYRELNLGCLMLDLDA